MIGAPLLAGIGFGAAVALISSAGCAADLGLHSGADADPFFPAVPVGVASALPRSPLADAAVFGTERFGSPAEAQARCPHDVVVRVEALSNVYRPTPASGPGVFMCKSSALSEGDRPR